MKALGIVRHIDGLGRIVIPMEVRRVNGWGTDTPMEMFSTEKGLVIREYKPNGEMEEILNQLQDVLESTTNKEVNKIIGRAIEFVKKG